MATNVIMSSMAPILSAELDGRGGSPKRLLLALPGIIQNNTQANGKMTNNDSQPFALKS